MMKNMKMAMFILVIILMFFYKNTSSIKIGYDKYDTLDCFYSLVDKNIPKKYLASDSLVF